ncbi:porin family protein [Vibrio sp. Isolate33]|uniref:porin family protein n=1 Tax=Vibrio sp. Isolate33 TaxID=2908539 RepID=UPI001EFE05A2|nr:porin family protein [Vibrio sp. Isolate33]MCG9546206.1 porin family protein [Vibrio sp. Isolate33]
MKLFKTAATIIALSTTTAAYANTDYSGHRVGLGFTSSEVDHLDSDYSNSDLGNGLKLEYGYDINRIVGVNISMDTSKDDESYYGYGYDSKVSTFKIDSDIGYAFLLNGFSIKPYGAIGVARVEEKLTLKEPGGSITLKDKETSLLLGTGVRANFDFGLYSDLRFNFIMMDDYDIDQLSITFGYKF